MYTRVDNNICLIVLVCFNGIENDRQCPNETHFSFYDQACVDPFYADCHIEEQKCAESIDTGLPVFLPNLRDCSSFFVCTNATSTLLPCAPGFHYVPELSRCAPVSSTNCTVRLNQFIKIQYITLYFLKFSIPDDITIPDLTFANCLGRHGERLPHPDSCQFYFLCLADKSYLQSCGSELVFDTQTNLCRDQSEALCILDVVTEPPPTTTEDSTTIEEDSTTIEEDSTTIEEVSTVIEEDSTITEDPTTACKSHKRNILTLSYKINTFSSCNSIKGMIKFSV